MRWILGLAVLALPLPAFAQENDAEKLFRAMEKKVREAKTLKVTCEADAKLTGKTGAAKLTVLAGEGNKLRLDADGNLGGKDLKIQIVSDGAQVGVSMDGGKAKATATPARMGEMLRGLFSRAGVFSALGFSRSADKKDEQFDVEKILPVRGFKLGAKEKLGDREAQVVEYTVSFEGREAVRVTLWIDTTTRLPLKRMLAPEKDAKQSITEVYPEFTVDPAIDGKAFTLPQ